MEEWRAHARDRGRQGGSGIIRLYDIATRSRFLFGKGVGHSISAGRRQGRHWGGGDPEDQSGVFLGET